MKIWIDDLRPMPEGFDKHFKTVEDTINFLSDCTETGDKIELISLDHDAGAEAKHGGDYITVLKYLEYLKKVFSIEICTKFHIHTGNVVGAQNMRQIIKSCGWVEIITIQEEKIMYTVDREEQIKKILNRLEQLVLKTEKEKNEVLYNMGEESPEYIEKEGYENGVFAAYAIVKKVIEGDYEE